MPGTIEYDVVIVGGGAAGLGLLAALYAPNEADDSLQTSCFEGRCALIDPHPIIARAEASDSLAIGERNLVLNTTSCRLLTDWGLWPMLEPYCHAVTEVALQTQTHTPPLSLSAEIAGVEMLGQVISSTDFLRILAQHIITKNISCIQSTLEKFRQGADGWWTLSLGNTILRTRLLIIADGAASANGHALGIHYYHQDYRQIAFSTAVCASGCTAKPYLAWQGYSDRETITLTPLRPLNAVTRFGVIVIVNRAYADHYRQLSAEQFGAVINDFIPAQFGKLQLSKAPFGYPLHFYQAQERIRRGLIMFGNAALSFHPVGAQNLNLHLRSAAALAQALNGHVTADFGSWPIVQKFFDATEKDFIHTMRMVTVMAKLTHNYRARYASLVSWLFGGLETQVGLKRTLLNKLIGGVV